MHRIDVRDRVKRLQKEPREDSRLEVDRLRRILKMDLIHLQSLHSALHPTASATVRRDAEDPHEESFNDSDDEAAGAHSEENPIIEQWDPELDLPPERIPLHLPSSYNTNTAAHPFHQAELAL